MAMLPTLFATEGVRPMTQEEKAQEVHCGCADEEARVPAARSEYLHDLRFQLAQSYYWSGKFTKDYLFFVCNWHPFLGMFLSHPQHPWSKLERILTFIISCSFTMLPVAIAKKYGRMPDFPGITDVAVFGLITVPVMITEVALYWLSIGDIYCAGSGHAGDCCGKLVNLIKHCCLGGSLFLSVLFVVVSYSMLHEDDTISELVRPMIVSRVQSYLTWIPIWFVLPCVGFFHVWHMEDKALSAAK